LSPTLVRFPPDGLGEFGEAESENRFADELAPKGLVDPKDDLRPFARPLKLF
jgi:hypothetical protein